MQRIIIGFGPPSSGKTTYLQPLVDEGGWRYVSPIIAAQEIERGSGEEARLGPVRRLMAKRITTGLQEGRNLVIEDWLCKQEERRALVAHCRAVGVSVRITGLWFSTNMATLRKWNEQRTDGRQVSEGRLHQLYGWLMTIQPEVADGFDELTVINMLAGA
jgi:predicted kinase